MHERVRETLTGVAREEARWARLPRLRRAMEVPMGGSTSELSSVVDTAAGASAPTVGGSIRLMSGKGAPALRGTFSAEG